MAEKRLNIQYGGDVAGVKRSHAQIDRLHNTLGAKLQRFGRNTSRVGSTLTRSLTLPILGFGAVAVQEFTEAGQAGAQTAAAIKSTGGAANVTQRHVETLSSKLARLSAVEDDEVQSAENVLLTFQRVSNQVGAGNDIFDQASLSIADMSARLGKDLNSSAIMVGKALNDPIRGVTALGRAGVQFTEKQRDMIASLVESGDVLGAQKIVLGELQTEFGGSARAAGKTASPIKKLTLAGKDLAETAGRFIVPMLSKAADFVGRLADRFDRLTPAQQKTIVKWGAIVAAAGPALYLVGKLVTGVGSLTRAFSAGSLKGGAYALALAAVGTAAFKLHGYLSMDDEKAKDWTKTITSGEATLAQYKAAVDDVSDGHVNLIDYLDGSAQVMNALDHTVEQVNRTFDRHVASLLSDTEAGERWERRLRSSGEMSIKQKRNLAALLATTEDYGITLSDSSRMTLEAFLKAGDYTSALHLLRRQLVGVLGPLKNALSYTEKQGEAAGDAAQKNQRYAYWLSQISKGAPGGGGGGGAPGGTFGGQRQHGGPVAARHSYLVGERGPEIFTASRSGQITPAGGGTTIVNVYVSGSVVSERELIDAVHKGLLRKQTRNGGRLGFAA